jgi:hypothetical protein
MTSANEKTSFALDGTELLFGVKKITLTNWQIPDLPRMFPAPAEDWVGEILEPQLTSNVPEDVVRLFEIARGSMVYGWFYYPLITLASEQLLRVMELAATKRCEQAGMPMQIPNKKGRTRDKHFIEKIQDLTSAGIISPSDYPKWDATRGLRNDRSHPSGAMIIHPGMGSADVKITCELINKLFL